MTRLNDLEDLVAGVLLALFRYLLLENLRHIEKHPTPRQLCHHLNGRARLLSHPLCPARIMNLLVRPDRHCDCLHALVHHYLLHFHLLVSDLLVLGEGIDVVDVDLRAFFSRDVRRPK